MTKRNPKQEGSNVWDCKPQSGLCPIGCNQCFYNRPGAFYVDVDEPHIPTLDEVGDGIMRVNSGHDSNCEREATIAATEQFPKRFFNTSLPKFDFPAPVVFTANRDEEVQPDWPDSVEQCDLDRIMFVRLRTSATNLASVRIAAARWADARVPVVLTFMAYYDRQPIVPHSISIDLAGSPSYVWKKRHVNSYWCPTRPFMEYALRNVQQFAGRRLVTMCGTLDSHLCKDCRNCETYYYQAARRMMDSA